MQVKSVRDLFVHMARDLYSAEKQMSRSLPKMIKACESQELQGVLKEHLEITNGQIERLDQIFESMEVAPGRMKCHAMEGLIEEGQEVIDECEGIVCDAAIIGAAQKIEHYEIASYGTARTIAQLLGENEAAQLLQDTLDEEKEADQKLNQVAQRINVQAEQEDDEEEEAVEDTSSRRNVRGKAAKGRNQ